VQWAKLTGLLIQAVQELDARQGVVTVKQSAQDNWQNLALALLALGLIYQQVQIRRLKK
jgi:hypothetical protein